MGRAKACQLRQLAESSGGLGLAQPLPEGEALAEALRPKRRRGSSVSAVEPYRGAVTAWWSQGIHGTTIHHPLVRQHRFTVILEFAPGEAAQGDLGAGSKLPEPGTGRPSSTWMLVMTLAWSRH